MFRWEANKAAFVFSFQLYGCSTAQTSSFLSLSLHLKPPLITSSPPLPLPPMAPSTGSNPFLNYLCSRSASHLVCGWPLQIPTLFFLLMVLSSSTTNSLANPDRHSSIKTSPPPSSSITTSQKVLIVLGSVSAFTILAFLAMAYFSKCFGLTRRGRSNGVAGDQVLPTTHEPFEAPQDSAGKNRVRRYGWQEIKKATENFNLVIGEGGFSTVYLGYLPDSSSMAAIKVSRTSERLHRAFKQELQVLLNNHHPNIVELLGYSDETEEGVLVFEYISNGSLHEMLHGHGDVGQVLPWARRMSIAYQLAGAINHLHENCELQIVHGDIKTSNILLDQQLNCKLSDFGTAKMGFSAAILPSPGSPSAANAVIGSPGYVDPHYIRTGIVSKKSDVYSFGVLLLELVTGMEAFHEEKGRLLSGAVRHVLGEPERAAEVVDGRLRGKYNRAEAAAVMAVAAACLREQPSLRPAMADVLLTMKEKVASMNTIPLVDKSKHLV